MKCFELQMKWADRGQIEGRQRRDEELWEKVRAEGAAPLVMNESYRRRAVPKPRRGDEAPKSFECEGGPLPI